MLDTEVMSARAIIFRLAALFVLLSSASDYSTYDLYDPSASMSLPGPALLLSAAAHPIALAERSTTNLPDDHCLCCCPSIALQRMSLESRVLILSVRERRVVQALVSDRHIIERPPRA